MAHRRHNAMEGGSKAVQRPGVVVAGTENDSTFNPMQIAYDYHQPSESALLSRLTNLPSRSQKRAQN
jgi:hypothetical protein